MDFNYSNQITLSCIQFVTPQCKCVEIRNQFEHAHFKGFQVKANLKISVKLARSLLLNAILDNLNSHDLF